MKKQEYCQNCGHKCHCDDKCIMEVTNEFGEKHKVECCSHCRHRNYEETDNFGPGEVEYDSLDIDSFNGA